MEILLAHGADPCRRFRTETAPGRGEFDSISWTKEAMKQFIAGKPPASMCRVLSKLCTAGVGRCSMPLAGLADRECSSKYTGVIGGLFQPQASLEVTC